MATRKLTQRQPVPPQAPRAWGYVRVSTPDQAESGLSIDEQQTNSTLVVGLVAALHMNPGASASCDSCAHAIRVGSNTHIIRVAVFSNYIGLPKFVGEVVPVYRGTVDGTAGATAHIDFRITAQLRIQDVIGDLDMIGLRDRWTCR